MHTKFKADNSALDPYVYASPKSSDTFFPPPAPLCMHGMRNDCTVEQCRLRFQHTKSSVVYSSAPKGPAPTLAMPVPANPTEKSVSISQPRQFGADDRGQSEMCFSQLTNAARMYPPLDESTALALARASAGGAMIAGDLGQGRSDMAL